MFSLSSVFRAVHCVLHSLSSCGDIKVVFAGTPSTDGKTVYLGPPPLNSQEALTVYLSHGTHEIHHVLYTDFKAASGLGGLHPLVNALEDVRIDALGYARFPGTRLWRESHLEALAKEGRLPVIQEGMSEYCKLCVTLFWHTAYLMQEFKFASAYAAECTEAFKNEFGKELWDKVRPLAERAVRCKSTRGVVSNAREIVRTFAASLAAEHFFKPDADASGQPADGSSGRPGPEVLGSQANKGKHSANFEEAGLTEGFSFSAKGACGAKRAKASARGASASQKGSSQGASDDIEALFEHLSSDAAAADLHAICEAQRNEVIKSDVSRAEASALNFWPLIRSEMPASDEEEFAASCAKIFGTQKSRFMRYLQAKEAGKSSVRRAGTGLSGRHLARIHVGDGRLFTKNETALRPSTAVSILLDRSGSMDRETMKTASVCAYALSELIESSAGCVSSVTAFPGLERRTLLEVKRFAEKTQAARARFSAIRSFGYTPVCETLTSAAAALSARREKRKIIFLLTDGLSSEEERLKACAQRLKGTGVEVLCLGIGEVVPALFEHQTNIKTAEEMPDAAYGLLKKIFDTL